MSYLSGIYLEPWFSWFGGGIKITLKKRRKQTEKEYSKIKRKKKEYRESQIATINVFGSTCYKNIYILLENIVWKRSLYDHSIFTVFCGCRVFEMLSQYIKARMDLH